MDEASIRALQRFIWSCTKVLAALLCCICGVLLWFSGDAAFTVAGYALVAFGLICAVWVYDRSIYPVVKKENSQNKE